jgi:hypothetical protein
MYQGNLSAYICWGDNFMEGLSLQDRTGLSTEDMVKVMKD